MLEKLIAIAREGGEIILSASNIAQSVAQKGSARNLVTDFDHKVQTLLRKRLIETWPDAHFIGEEDDIHDSIDRGLAFIVDPIDGTANFVKGYHCSAVCIAAAVDGHAVCGVIFDPYTNSMYAAEKGKGAWRNDVPIHVATGEDSTLENGLVCMGTSPYYTDLHDRTFRLMRALFDVAMDIRRSGSAALDICAVACGRAVLMAEERLSPWDYAAAALIAEEAGAKVSRIEGDFATLTHSGSILVATPAAWTDFFKRGMDKL